MSLANGNGGPMQTCACVRVRCLPLNDAPTLDFQRDVVAVRDHGPDFVPLFPDAIVNDVDKAFLHNGYVEVRWRWLRACVIDLVREEWASGAEEGSPLRKRLGFLPK